MERQLDEALEALKEEREQKNSLRRELSALTLNPFDSAGNLELHLDQLDDSQEEGRGGEGDAQEETQDSSHTNRSAPSSKSNGLVHRYSTPRNSDVFLRPPASGLVSDLLSELHFSDSQKLKQQLLQVCNRTSLTTHTNITLMILKKTFPLSFRGGVLCKIHLFELYVML